MSRLFQIHLFSLFLVASPLPVSLLAQEPLNVLFLAIDDLRPELGNYGGAAPTPHMDALAARGLSFDSAYCNYTVCNPSRASLMTGLRPDTIRTWDLVSHFRDTTPDVVTLPEQFKRHGYFTQGIGKVYHRRLDDPVSWSVPHQPPAYDSGTGTSWRFSAGAESEEPDAETADRAIQALRNINEIGRPFFLAVGFIRPHLPFVAPQSYYDLHPPESVALPANSTPPENVPAIALHDFPVLRRYEDIPPTGPLSEEMGRELIRGYRASVSFVDAQVGRVLSELDRLGLGDNTIVVLWSDHGYHLGEQSLWTKFTNFDIAARVPLILSVPGQATRGERSSALVELIDLYPTLCELTGVPMPAVLEGRSFAPLLAEPERPWKTAVFSQHVREQFLTSPISTPERMGYSIRTESHRYTEWIRWSNGEVLARELYDHVTDPAETVNTADVPGNASLVAELSQRLQLGWEAALESVPAPPLAVLSTAPDSPQEGKAVQLDGGASTTADGQGIVSYKWDFGDGESAEGQAVNHTYARPGVYTIQLITEDTLGRRGVTERAIRVNLRCEDVAPWSSFDIGDTGAAGCARLDDGGLLVFAGGKPGADNFHFVNQEFMGDTIITARVAGFSPTDAVSAVGVMLRESLDAGSKHASIFFNQGSTETTMKFIRKRGLLIRITTIAEIPDTWVRIERQGNEFIGYHSPNGILWTELGRETIELPEVIFGGVAVTAINTAANEIVFAEVTNLYIGAAPDPRYIRGDGNGDGRVNIADASYVAGVIFGLPFAPITCEAAADANGDGGVNIADPTYIANFLFGIEPAAAPPAPFPDCALVPPEEPLGCLGTEACIE